MFRLDRALTAPPLPGSHASSLIATFSLLFGLTTAESRIFARLVKFDHATKPELHAAMADGDPTTDINIVDVTMSRLRRKLKPHNIAIVTAHRLGYRLAEDSRMRIRELLADYGADVVAAATPPVGQTEDAKGGV